MWPAMTAERAPAWLDAIRIRIEQHPSTTSNPNARGSLKAAAVLVLLVDSQSGPSIVLTERAGTLRNYPGILAFPGGATDASDEGPVATALREAVEETGVDPESIHVIGLLPPRILPATQFWVTPVIGWCAGLELSGATSPNEVASVVQVPLDELDMKAHSMGPNTTRDGRHSGFSVGGTAVGAMTAEVIHVLLGHRQV